MSEPRYCKEHRAVQVPDPQGDTPCCLKATLARAEEERSNLIVVSADKDRILADEIARRMKSEAERKSALAWIAKQAHHQDCAVYDPDDYLCENACTCGRDALLATPQGEGGRHGG